MEIDLSDRIRKKVPKILLGLAKEFDVPVTVLAKFMAATALEMDAYGELYDYLKSKNRKQPRSGS